MVQDGGVGQAREAWVSEFRDRMRSFESLCPPREGEVSISLKVRVTSGCFHREHSPLAYETIGAYLASMPDAESAEIQFIEHESGPELLIYSLVILSVRSSFSSVRTTGACP